MASQLGSPAANRIEFIVEDDPNGSSRGVLVPYIDGTDLRDIIRVDAEGPAEPFASPYGGIPLSAGLPLRRRYLGHSATSDYSAVITVLGCSCGIVECGPLRVEISVDSDFVTWHRFPQLKASDRLGPFTFDRWEYEAGLTHVEKQMGVG